MTAEAAGWGAPPDLGLERTFDLSRTAVRARTVRRRLLVVLTLVAVVGGTMAFVSLAPDVLVQPVLGLPATVALVGGGLLGLAVLVMLVGLVTMVRSGADPFANHDPLLDLPRSDRSWIRARIVAGAPVTPGQQPVVVGAAGWMGRQRGTMPLHLGLALEGLGFVLTDQGVLSAAVGLVLVVEGLALAHRALARARTARRWLSLYAPAELRQPAPLSAASRSRW